jgi:hypothetical protein
MNRSAVVYAFIAVIVIIGSSVTYLFMRNDAVPDIPGIPETTGQAHAKTMHQYLYDIEGANDMADRCKKGIEDRFFVGCGHANGAIDFAREWIPECFTREEGKFKSNANTHACLAKHDIKEDE